MAASAPAYIIYAMQATAALPSLDEVEFIYLGDPMCSWCWGFAPVLEQIQAHYDVPIRTIIGGIRPGKFAEPLNDRLRRYLMHVWTQVEARSGQPFDHRGYDRESWIYDSELPARAIVTMRALNPDATLAFLTRLQRAFYAEAVDVTDPAVYPELLDGFEVDRDKLLELLGDESSRQAAWKDFEMARELGVSGFPCLLLRLGSELLMVARGYLPWEQLEPALSGWLRDHYGADAVVGLFCDIDGSC